ncbi:MAG TPA: M23 family metallopeptidase [Mucilaginibacter sp.]|jgi:murein DD-endopeptidase MepM/ murein hydrolase activator NlpD|nr:M23 family metallopeptidase [Mucilaginibacter sp.]
MNLKLTNFSTIIIVNKNQEQTKSIRVKTKHLKRVKHYAVGISCIILALAGTVIYLSSKGNKQEQEKQQLLSEIAQLKSKLPAAEAAALTDVTSKSTAQGYIESIQGKLQKINDYLKKRGLKGFSTKDIGGDNSASVSLSDNEKYSLYDEYVGKLLNSMAFTPMGYPRLSSITSGFGYRSNPFDSDEGAELHPGVDFRGAKGDPVRVTADGKVAFTGWKGGYGNCIIVQHKNDFQTLYGHLSHIGVEEGQQVKTGDVIGKVGSTGRTTGPHLHYEVRKNGKPINPVKFLSLNN